MLDFLYSIIIYPLYQIVEVCYSLSDAVVKNQGLAVIGVSLGVSFLCLPLYVIAERWQEVERQTQAQLKPGIDRIKTAFKGDEQYMILNTYYRQNHYHPVMALRSSISLLIQIPFFIAAYRFLSHLDALKGFSFLCFKDFGEPDALFHIGSFNINVLPIAMTLINIGSGVIYSKGHPIREKVQIYVMALFFLVFLYDSPSGLVFYWTLNNVFSLVKNVFYKFKKPLRALYFCLVAGVALVDVYLIFFHGGMLRNRLLLVFVLMIVPLSPLVIKLFGWLLNNPLKNFVNNAKARNICFFTTAISLAIFLGYVIPSFLISSSPMEFSFVDEYTSPFFFVKHNLWIAIGFCVFWPTCIYFLFNDKVKSVIVILLSSLLLCGLVNAFVFGGDYGTISTVLTFTNAGTIPPAKMYALLTLLVSIIIIALIIMIFTLNRTQYVSYAAVISMVSFIAISIYNSTKISKGYKEAVDLHSENTDKQLAPAFHLSKTEKNVLYIMEDRGISGYLKYAMEENPELIESFRGFTFYPNTVSFGGMTLIGSPALYGGYEYSPEEINRRNKEALVDKHNEALKVMPVLFSENGFDTTVTDMSWANYTWIPDLRIFNDYPDIHKEPTMRYYNSAWQNKNPDIQLITKQSEKLKRNFIWFGLFKIMPPVLRNIIYDEGYWWSQKSTLKYYQDFIDSYSVLELLPELVDSEGTKPTFSILVNETTHEPVMMNYPKYNLANEMNRKPEDQKFADGSFYDDEDHFNVNAAAFNRLGEFFDYLKKIGVYDNTRIILISDHGGWTRLCENTLDEMGDLPLHPRSFNPLLLIKDFNSNDDFKIDNTFMTNADGPILATEGLIDNPKNPFTGKYLKDCVNKDKIFVATDSFWSPDGHPKNTYKIDSWASVHDNIFDPKNWTVEEPNFSEAK